MGSLNQHDMPLKGHFDILLNLRIICLGNKTLNKKDRNKWFWGKFAMVRGA